MQGVNVLITMSHSNQSSLRDSRAWQYQVWISFGIAISMCAIGLAWLPGQHLEQAFMVMGYMFCLSAAFVLAKFVRDNQQSGQGNKGDTPMWRFVVWGGFADRHGPDRLGFAEYGHQPHLQSLFGCELALHDYHRVHAGQDAARQARS